MMLRSCIAAARTGVPVLSRPQNVLRSQLRVQTRPLPAKRVQPMQQCTFSRSLFHASKADKAVVQDGMTRFPAFNSSMGLLRGLDYFGTLVFAISGTVTAGAAGMDILGCVSCRVACR